MYNQYDQLQTHTFTEATKLAAAGSEFSHLIGLLTPEYALRLKLYVQNLPDDIRQMTIYGRAVSKSATKPTKRR